MVQATFDLLDGDGNGKLSGDEWKRAGWTADRLTAFDADGNGELSAREFQSGRRFEREFNSKDLNGDGKLSRTEFLGVWFKKLADTPLLAKLAGVKEALGAGEKPAEKAVAKLDAGFAHPSPTIWRDRFSQADTNRDGAVSKGEYLAARRQETTPVIQHWPIHRPVLADAKAAANDE
ncbi:EF hand [compost metagenome]